MHAFYIKISQGYSTNFLKKKFEILSRLHFTAIGTVV